MIRTLIVEDDIFDYSHLKNIISWEKQGFILYDRARNGKEAIKCIDKGEVDFLITDMSMPGIDGIEVIKYVRENYSHIKILAISGYDDFVYVKESFKMGAIDYILKHNLNSESLRQILNKIKDTISEEQKLNLEKRKIEKQIKTGKDVLIKNFINRMIKEGIEDKLLIKQELKNLGLKLYWKKLVIVSSQIDDYNILIERYFDSEINNLKKSFTNMVNEILKDMTAALMTFLKNGNFVIIFSFENKNSEQDIYNKVTTTINRIQSTIKQNFNITSCFAISDICNDISEIDKYYARADRLLKKKFYRGKGKIFFNHSITEINNKVHYLEINEEKNITNSIKKMDYDLMIYQINQVFNRIIKFQPSVESVKLIIVSFINIINKLAREFSIDTKNFYGQGDNFYEDLDRYETIWDVKKWVMEIYKNFYNYLKNNYIVNDYTEITDKAIKYINDHYNEKISLSNVANKIGLSSSYLSRKFKEDCGKGFVEYLNSIRIEKAKFLIENTNYSIKELVPMVGFNNYNYFFKVFKDIEGMTPHEYEIIIENK